jgi:hypothetical protein
MNVDAKLSKLSDNSDMPIIDDADIRGTLPLDEDGSCSLPVSHPLMIAACERSRRKLPQYRNKIKIRKTIVLDQDTNTAKQGPKVVLKDKDTSNDVEFQLKERVASYRKCWCTRLSWVHIWLTASHVFFIPVLIMQYKLWYNYSINSIEQTEQMEIMNIVGIVETNDDAQMSLESMGLIEGIKLGMILGVVIASTLMHLSETKHGIRPDTGGDKCGKCLGHCSFTFLSCDIMMALITALFFIFLTILRSKPNPQQWLLALLALVGGIANHIGERSTSLVTYFRLHCFWHATVALGMYVFIVSI